MEIYKKPEIESVELLGEGCIMAGSTGENFETLEDYDGTWS